MPQLRRGFGAPLKRDRLASSGRALSEQRAIRLGAPPIERGASPACEAEIDSSRGASRVFQVSPAACHRAATWPAG